MTHPATPYADKADIWNVMRLPLSREVRDRAYKMEALKWGYA